MDTNETPDAEAPETEDFDEPTEGRLLQIPGDDGPRSDVPTQVVTYAVAIGLPDSAGDEAEAAEFGGRMLQDALSLYGLSVAGIVHHRDGSALFPDGVPELGAAPADDDGDADADS